MTRSGASSPCARRVERADGDAGGARPRERTAASAGSASASPTSTTDDVLAQLAQARRGLDAVAAVVAGPGEDEDRRACGARASASRATQSPARAISAKGGRGDARASPRGRASTATSCNRPAGRRSNRCAMRIDVITSSRSMPSPSISIGVVRPAIASASELGRARGERPAAAAVADVEPDAGSAAGAEHGRTVGQHRPRALPALRRRAPRHAGEPVVEHLVERRLGVTALALAVAADLGAAGDAHAIAHPRDRDLVALVHQRRARLEVQMLLVVAQRRGDRIAVDRDQRQMHAERREQRSRADGGADDDGVEARLGDLARIGQRRLEVAGVAARAQRLVARVVRHLGHAQARPRRRRRCGRRGH